MGVGSANDESREAALARARRPRPEVERAGPPAADGRRDEGRGSRAATVDAAAVASSELPTHQRVEALDTDRDAAGGGASDPRDDRDGLVW